MTDIAINRCPKGTFISEAGLVEFARRKGVARESVDAATLDRTDADLIAMMRENPAEYGGLCAHIAIITVDFPWKILRKGNFEWVASDA